MVGLLDDIRGCRGVSSWSRGSLGSRGSLFEFAVFVECARHKSDALCLGVWILILAVLV